MEGASWCVWGGVGAGSPISTCKRCISPSMTGIVLPPNLSVCLPVYLSASPVPIIPLAVFVLLPLCCLAATC